MSRWYLKILFLLICTCSTQVNAQIDSTSSPLKFNAYIDIYYNYNFYNSAKHKMPNFMYSYSRHNEVNLNLGLIKAGYAKNNNRANLALMAGTYANDNLAGEPGVLKNIYEANVGIKISKTKNIWIDAGIFPSHIGFESAIGKNCWTLTRSIVADNSPYYESGAKLSYTSLNNKWFLSALVLNGWQNIQRANGNNTPAFGHQLTFTPNKKFTINSSSFIGNCYPDNLKRMRYYHNLFTQIQVSEKIAFIAGVDIGAEQTSKYSSNYNIWYSPVLIIKYSVSNTITIAARGEYYSDNNNAIIYTSSNKGFNTIGYSLNFDYKISENTLWRIEGRGFNDKNKAIVINNSYLYNNYFIATALLFYF